MRTPKPARIPWRSEPWRVGDERFFEMGQQFEGRGDREVWTVTGIEPHAIKLTNEAGKTDSWIPNEVLKYMSPVDGRRDA